MEIFVQGDEALEEWDWAAARPTGRMVMRRRAHREGVPHEGVHLWILRTVSGMPEVLFQRRARHKEHYPDCLDITVGGHVLFGQTEGKIQKEASGEIGISPADEELVDLGYYRYEELTPSLFHREFQRVYLLRDERPLSGYRFTDGEVTGIYAVPLEKLESLFNDDFSFEIEGFDGRGTSRRPVRKADFHPLLFAPSMTVYMEVLFRAMHELAAGADVSVRMPSPAG
jgi:isopentenyldiphosphate isomerase